MSESLSRLIKTSIDTWITQLRNESPLVHAAERGEVGPRALALYLESLRYVFAHSHANIRAAKRGTYQFSYTETLNAVTSTATVTITVN